MGIPTAVLFGFWRYIRKPNKIPEAFNIPARFVHRQGLPR
jgi:hypothetical protein